MQFAIAGKRNIASINIYWIKGGIFLLTRFGPHIFSTVGPLPNSIPVTSISFCSTSNFYPSLPFSLFRRFVIGMRFIFRFAWVWYSFRILLSYSIPYSPPRILFPRGTSPWNASILLLSNYKIPRASLSCARSLRRDTRSNSPSKE